MLIQTKQIVKETKGCLAPEEKVFSILVKFGFSTSYAHHSSPWGHNEARQKARNLTKVNLRRAKSKPGSSLRQ